MHVLYCRTGLWLDVAAQGLMVALPSLVRASSTLLTTTVRMHTETGSEQSYAVQHPFCIYQLLLVLASTMSAHSLRSSVSLLFCAS
jgi:hypothetical protein